MNVLSPIERKVSNSPPKNVDYSRRCAYCSDAPGHDTEKCWFLKKAIQELIDTQQIVVQNSDAPNINQNPLPTHTETNMLELIHGGEESIISYKPIIKIKSDEEKTTNVVDLTKAVSSGVNKTPIKPKQSNTPMVIEKGASESVGSSQMIPKLIAPRMPAKPLLIVKGALTAPIIIKPVSQLPMVNTKTVPWNYNRTTVTYKGKEVFAEVDGIGGVYSFREMFYPRRVKKR